MAERKCGELLKDREMNKGGDPRPPTLKVGGLSPKSLKEIGISKNNSSAWQRLADIPEEIFEKERKMNKGAAVSQRGTLKVPREEPKSLKERA